MGLFRRLSVAAVVFTYLLIVVGGIVRVSGSGLGCPDWPTCHGGLIPPLVGHSLIEYSHRFTAAIVTILAIAVAVLAWARHRDERRLVVPATIAVLLLIVQIVLGAITVELKLPPTIVAVHLATALAVFAAIIVTAVASMRIGRAEKVIVSVGLARLILATAVLTYLLMLVGTYITADGAAFACAAWPMCGSGFQPPVDALSSQNFLHRLLAGTVTVLYAVVFVRVARLRRDRPRLFRHVVLGAVLLLAQILVGAGVVWLRIGADITAVHIALAAAFWAQIVALAALAYLDRSTDGQPIGNLTKPLTEPVKSPQSVGGSIGAYISLMKPGIILLLLFTTFGAMVMAARGLPPLWLIGATLAGGALASGGAGAINCYIDRDIDAIMSRTRRRPLATGRVSPENALRFGLILGVLAFVLLAVTVNLLSAVLSMAGLLFYVLIYTAYLKRSTTQNIVIGGIAGSIPPLVGWAAVTNSVELPALYLFAIIFFWTPPHFWALSLLTYKDYEAAHIPMLPVAVGERETRRQIFLYSLLLIATTLMVVGSRAVGMLYLGAAILLGAGMIYYAGRLLQTGTARQARQLFMYSNIYLALIFAAMAIDRVTVPSLH